TYRHAAASRTRARPERGPACQCQELIELRVNTHSINTVCSIRTQNHYFYGWLSCMGEKTVGRPGALYISRRENLLCMRSGSQQDDYGTDVPNQDDVTRCGHRAARTKTGGGMGHKVHTAARRRILPFFWPGSILYP